MKLHRITNEFMQKLQLMLFSQIL